MDFNHWGGLTGEGVERPPVGQSVVGPSSVRNGVGMGMGMGMGMGTDGGDSALVNCDDGYDEDGDILTVAEEERGRLLNLALSVLA